MRNIFAQGLMLLAMTLWITGCTSASPAESQQTSVIQHSAESAPQASLETVSGPSNVFYEVFVRAFADSDGNGIGDLNGLTAKLDYIESLGADGIWLMPIQPSPSYHGYDVTDYYGINPDYGTLDDFKRLLAEAHKRDIRIIMDLVVNHTSVEHPWFVDSAKGKDSKYHDWYIWAKDRDGGASPTDGATGAEPWHAKGDDEYLGVFWEGMPDLNFDNPEVRKEMIAIGKYWLKAGVDGFRLDAAKHIFGDFKSTIGTPAVTGKNQAWWQEFRAGLNTVNPNAYLVGEVWDGAAIIAPYLDNALDSAFNFDLAASLLSAATSEKATDIGFTLSRVHEFYGKASKGKFVEAPFLSNHDQTRVMTAVGNNVHHAKMAAALLLTMPGNPFIYYGEELGMSGMKPDERLREPFAWTRALGSPEETTWEEAQYRGNGEISVEAEEESPGSLLNHYRTIIAWRAQEPALRGGTIASYDTDNTSIASYIRGNVDEQLLVLNNLSGQPQTLTLAVTKSQPTAFVKLALSTNSAAKLEGQLLELPAYTTVVLKP
jgi:alpha-amylase